MASFSTYLLLLGFITMATAYESFRNIMYLTGWVSSLGG